MTAAEATSDAPVLHRQMRPEDAPFVFGTWTRWVRSYGRWLRLLPDRVFFNASRGYRAHVEQVVARSRVLVACDPDAPEVIFGYAVAEPPRLLHMVYVRGDMRRRWRIGSDLARALIPKFGQEETVCTMDRPAFDVFARKFRLKFNPFATPIVGSEFREWADALRDSFDAVRGGKR